MKTTIIKVELSDDIMSVRDRIAWSSSQRILMIIPRNIRNFPDERGLVLLNRAAQAKGAQLGLVTRQTNLREFAKKNGVSIFRTVTRAERETWVEPSRTAHITPRGDAGSIIEMRKDFPDGVPPLPVKHIPKYSLFIASAAALLIIGLLILPSATVVIYPETHEQEQLIEIHALSSVNQNNITGVIPAYKHTFTVSGELSDESSGSVEVGKTRSSGEVVLTNLTSQDIELPQGTGFSTASPDQQRFTSTKDAVIPGRGSAVTIPIEAVYAGEEGNVAAGEIVLIEGPAGTSLKVRNDTPTIGGSSINLPAPSVKDYESLTLRLLDELKSKALEQSMLESDAARKPILESLALEEISLEEKVNPIGEPADTLSLRITVQYSVLYYDPAALSDLFNTVMDVAVPIGFQAAEENMIVEKVGDISINGADEAVWQVHLMRKMIKSYSQQEIRKAINGKAVNQAVALVNREIPQVRSAEIRSMISWWPYVPVLLDQIHFEERLTDGG